MIVHEKFAITLVLLGNLICIGEMVFKVWKRFLEGHMWSVASLSKIQGVKEEISPNEFADDGWIEWVEAELIWDC